MAVILSTSLGDIVIDLHTDLCPLTSKNFLKLCKLKYYNNCLFHDVEKDFIAQTGDPSGTGSGGDSLYKHIYGDQARFFNDEFHPKLTHDKMGTVAMASAGENLNASQFYITLRAGLDYLDGKHTVFGEVAEGLETLMRINEAYTDDKGRPYKNIRIKRVDILDDPFEDPPQLEDLIPAKSPVLKPPAEGEEVRLEDDWIPMDEQMDPEELDKSLRQKEAHSRAVVLEMIGDIPEAEVAPPENVLFICKLNPVTEEGDLETIFSRFGKVLAADIIRDYKSGESLCYGFIEFENKESCEAAYFKMDNVLIDDRRIHVDFSQSVARLWTRFRKFGAKDADGQGAGLAQGKGKGGECFNCGEYGHVKKDCPNGTTGGEEQDAAPVEKPKYTLKESAGQRGNPRNRYEMVFEENNEASLSSAVDDAAISKASRGMTGKLYERPSEGRRAQLRFAHQDVRHDRNYYSGRNERPRHRFGDERADSDDDSRRWPLSRDTQGDRRDRSRRNERPRDRVLNERAAPPYISSRERAVDTRDYSGRKERPRKKYRGGSPDSDVDTRKRAGSTSPARVQYVRRHHSAKNEHDGNKYVGEKSTSGDEKKKWRAQSPLSTRHQHNERRGHSLQNGQHRESLAERGVHSDDMQKWAQSPSPAREQYVRRDHSAKNEQHGNSYRREESISNDDKKKRRPQSPLSTKHRHNERQGHLVGNGQHGERHVKMGPNSDDNKQKRARLHLSSRQKQDERRGHHVGHDLRRGRDAEDGRDSDVDNQKRARSPLSAKPKQDSRRDFSGRNDRHRESYVEERTNSDDDDKHMRPGPSLSTRKRQDEKRDRPVRNGQHRDRFAEDRPFSDIGDQKTA